MCAGRYSLRYRSRRGADAFVCTYLANAILLVLRVRRGFPMLVPAGQYCPVDTELSLLYTVDRAKDRAKDSTVTD